MRDVLVERARREGQGEDGWHREWEQAVNELVERIEGWRCAQSYLYSLGSFPARVLPVERRADGPLGARSWPTFWKMTHNTLRNLDVPHAVLEARAARSRWPAVPPELRPPVAFVVSQVRALLSLPLTLSLSHVALFADSPSCRSDLFSTTSAQGQRRNGDGSRASSEYS